MKPQMRKGSVCNKTAMRQNQCPVGGFHDIVSTKMFKKCVVENVFRTCVSYLDGCDGSVGPRSVGRVSIFLCHWLIIIDDRNPSCVAVGMCSILTPTYDCLIVIQAHVSIVTST